MRDWHVRILALVLAGAGLALAAYKVDQLGLPLDPGRDAPVWTVEARISMETRGGAVKAELILPPKRPPGFWILDEDYISSNFGLALEDETGPRTANWAVRRVSGRKSLYYRIRLFQDPEAHRERAGPVPPFPDRPVYPEPLGSAISTVIDGVRAESADVATFTQELLIRLDKDRSNENIELIHDEAPSEAEWARQLVQILAGARIPTRIVWGIELRESMNQGQLSPMIEVHNGERWLAFNPRSGERGFPRRFLVWKIGDRELVSTTGARNVEVQFAAASRVSDLVSIAQQRARITGSRAMDFSLFSLPVATQNLYRVLLTVPLGIALLVVLRNVVGVKTFGTFMPVLIALAFRETNLLWGVLLFVLLVSIGLLLRFYLATLKLLLVPRLASVVIIVILLMSSISVLSHRLGFEQGLSIALFPMVVLAMTIERMSIVWEEHGPRESILQGFGSLAVACAAYTVMQHATLQYLVFVFPELLLVVLAGTMLLGRYKGYRLTELWRFRSALRSGAG